MPTHPLRPSDRSALRLVEVAVDREEALRDLVLLEVAPALVLAVGDEAGRRLRVRLLVRRIRLVEHLDAHALVGAARLLEDVEAELEPAVVRERARGEHEVDVHVEVAAQVAAVVDRHHVRQHAGVLVVARQRIDAEAARRRHALDARRAVDLQAHVVARLDARVVHHVHLHGRHGHGVRHTARVARAVHPVQVAVRRLAVGRRHGLRVDLVRLLREGAVAVVDAVHLEGRVHLVLLVRHVLDGRDL
mmetsp:Transcript_27020/g.93783  ORF Transcript_27020/g.93783 Transcript_27020/m.93783 type:complete len:247 (+) Transcript_27020:172-912(+)